MEVQNVFDVWAACEKYKKALQKPNVGSQLAKVFNHFVCMDFKDYVHNKTCILHLIDSSMRYSSARVIFIKKDEEVVNNIYLMWTAYFNYPVKFLADNGGMKC